MEVQQEETMDMEHTQTEKRADKKRRPRPVPAAEIMTSPITKSTSRYGRSLGNNRIFEKSPRWSEEELAVGSPQFLLKPLRSEREVAFGTSTRDDWGRILGTIPKINPNAGPGSYRVIESMTLSSEMPRQPTIRFPCSVRPSMDLKTDGPGPIYDLSLKESSKILIGFNLDHRKPINVSATDAMYSPKIPKGKSCTIKKRHEPSPLKLSQMKGGPAPHDYDVIGASSLLQKQPSFSFGKGSARFEGVDKVAEMMKKLEKAEKNGN